MIARSKSKRAATFAASLALLTTGMLVVRFAAAQAEDTAFAPQDSPAVPASTRPSPASEPSTRAADDGKYLGFTIDDSRVRNLANLAEVQAATKEQINIVCAVGLPDEILKFLKTVPLTLVPPRIMLNGTPGLYSGMDRRVSISAGIVTIGHKPVLLHELLHAYHDQRIESGFRNPETLAFYQHAKTIPAFSATSHMMQNGAEYFACSGTTYLFGVTAQEPFKREKVKENQPEIFEYFKKLFGPQAGSYEGSLTK
jgi:hypothetical protein